MNSFFLSQRVCSILLWLIIFSAISCRESPQAQNVDAGIFEKSKIVKRGVVSTLKLSNGQFYDEVISNGKLEAGKKWVLQFNTEGVIAVLRYKNGEKVKKGDLIASLDDQEEIQKLKMAKLKFQKSILDYEDQLLKSGYSLIDTPKLSNAIKSVAKIRSGYANSEIELQQATVNYHRTKLYAPIDGIIANSNFTESALIAKNVPLCSVISNNKMYVSFQLMEQELGLMAKQKQIVVTPYSIQRKFKAHLVSINPVVDKGGMVMLKGILEDISSELMDGMSVGVTIQINQKKALVIPKEAVLDRGGRKVVFTVKDSSAIWNYVNIVGENTDGFAVEGLKFGDEVVINGNYDLVHMQSLTVQN